MDPTIALIDALFGNDRDAIDRAIRAVPDVNAGPKDHHGPAPLHYAAQEHSAEGTRALLEAGAHVDVLDEHGNTPLHYASFDRVEPDETIGLLLRAGAAPGRAANQHPDVFSGQSVIAPYDQHGIVLRVDESGLLSALRRPWSDTYHPQSNDDWEHVFSHLPHDLLIPVTLAWLIGRLPTGSANEPVQLSAIRLDALPTPFPAPTDPEYEARDLDTLGHVTRLPTSNINRAVQDGQIADPETVALVYAIHHEIDHPY
ncbi:ankyrin repeat domain-containing protein [Patulibacter sp.]|uniref:ankyrin repeat domain-containing protein n=1 Tax=Patulibacter sp. TaxID=1912859 RepID=UPI002722820E|nr:ankyrin repeat domain-containing protein [Patulibacter sp.]MDO9410479.1 ankyrin repeat domain-containing protein [Patulibacter sp.]